MNFEIDSGACVSVAKIICHVIIIPTDLNEFIYTQEKVKPVGKVKLSARYQNIEKVFELYILEMLPIH